MNRRNAGIGTYTFIVGIFGFIFVMLTFVVAGEIFDVFEVWAVTVGSGYDADIFTFFVQFWYFFPAIFLFAFGLWGWNELQKQESSYA